MVDTPDSNAENSSAKTRGAPKKGAASNQNTAPDVANEPTTGSSAATNAITEAPQPTGTADDLKSKAKDEFNNFKSKATDGARAAAEKGKDRASEAVASISKLIRDSAATIDENVGSQYGNYARSAADSVDGFASKIDEKDVDQLVGDARDFVRKSPAVAIGAAAAIGFVLARLVRSGRNDA